MEACYGGTDVMERSCAVARGIDINKYYSRHPPAYFARRRPCISLGLGNAYGIHVSWRP
jgi:hypothetical protein